MTGAGFRVHSAIVEIDVESPFEIIPYYMNRDDADPYYIIVDKSNNKNIGKVYVFSENKY